MSWAGLNETYIDAGITGFSLIVDDIQRVFGIQNNSKSIAYFHIQRLMSALNLTDFDLTEGIEHYFRLAVSLTYD